LEGRAEQARVLALTDQEKASIIDDLERIVAMRADDSDSQTFDPFTAQDAADRLKRWCVKEGNTAWAERAPATAGQALERASDEASSLTAIAWLSQLLKRYHEAGDEAGVARIEQDDAAGWAARETRELVPILIVFEGCCSPSPCELCGGAPKLDRSRPQRPIDPNDVT
jgi:hypothetical protein